MDVAPPPRYRRSSTRPGQVPQSGNELPAYTRRNTLAQPLVRREPTEHVYLLTEKNRAWVTLKIQSSAKSNKSLPTFFEKENVNGSLEINADKGDSIHSITATVWKNVHLLLVDYSYQYKIGYRSHYYWSGCRRCLHFPQPLSSHLVEVSRCASSALTI